MVTMPKAPASNTGATNASQAQILESEAKAGVELRADWFEFTIWADTEVDESEFQVVEPVPGELTGGFGFSAGTLADYEIGNYNDFDAEKPGALYAPDGLWAIQRREAIAKASLERKMRQALLAVSLAMEGDPDDWIGLPDGHGRNFYNRAMLGPNGARLDFGPTNMNERDHFHFTLTGTACSAIGGKRLQKLMQYVIRAEGKATRVDIVMDDYDKVKTPAQVARLYRVEDDKSLVITHARRGKTINSFSKGGGDITADTFYAGSDTSRNKLRVYDKDQQSGGEYKCIRWELQCRKESADMLMQSLAEVRWGVAIPERFVSFIDFRSRDKVRIIDRGRLGWWARLVNNAEKANMYPAKATKTLEDMSNWTKKAVAPTLAAIYIGTGSNMAEIENLIKGGMRRMKPRQKDAVLAWQGSGKGNLSLSYEYMPSGLASKMKEAQDAFYPVA